MSTNLALDEAAWESRWRHRPVSEKCLLSVGLVLAALVLPTWPGSPLVIGTAMVLLLGPARVPPALLLRAASWPLTFLITGAIPMGLSVSWRGGLRVAPSASGMFLAAGLVAHGMAGALSLFLLAATTPMVDLLEFLRRMRVPAVCIDVAGVTYRLLFALCDTAGHVRESQEARLGYHSWRSSLDSAGSLTVSVLLGALQKAQRLEEGLAGRGYVDALPSVTEDRRPSVAFVTASLAGIAALSALTLLGAP